MRKQKQLSTYDDVREKALALLEFRSHSEKELSDKLKRYGASHEHIDQVLDLCRRYGFVNDASYAMRKAKDLANLKKFGVRRIRAELKMKGIPDNLIEDALSQLDDDELADNLSKLIQKKLSNDFSRKNIDKCIRYFIYRGYDIYDIKDRISELSQYNDDEYYD